MRQTFLGVLALLLTAGLAKAGVGDPQLGTDHPWYRGELSCSTFERLQATQAELYQRVVGVRPSSDEHKALAAWLWRNTHCWHGEEGAEDLWGQGFTRGGDLRTREYWTGLFAHGFGLCGTTHSQWVAEMEALLGHSRGRGVGVDGHNAFEVYLTGGPYGAGKWVLLDHDLSTVIFNKDGTALLSIPEICADWKRLTDRAHAPARQHGWLVCGLHPSDGAAYRKYAVAEHLAGYAGPPPMVHLRRGETLRRYLRPGLDDGKAFVFWGRNYNTPEISGLLIPGPERSHTWVNQPHRMHGSNRGAFHNPGQARYANAVFTYKPDFTTADYREGIVREDDHSVTFEFSSPYIIAATPAGKGPWDIYQPGCRNGLVLRGKADCRVSLSTDRGRTWQDCGTLTDGMDLTDRVKGRRQYLLRFGAKAATLAKSSLSMTTVCQANSSVLPRLKAEHSQVSFEASGQAVVSAGPGLEQARTHLVEGKFATPRVTLEVASLRGEPAVAIHAAAHVLSGSPPKPEIKYQIELSTDGSKTWKPMVKDWTIPRRGDEPPDFWSQSFCWGSARITEPKVSTVRVRFRNDGGRNYARCEAHLVYRTAGDDPTRVTFAYTADAGIQQATHIFAGTPRPAPWSVRTGRKVETHWVEMTPAPR
jgi:hypothetical protein